MIERGGFYVTTLTLPIQNIGILLVGNNEIVFAINFVMQYGFGNQAFSPFKIPLGNQLPVPVKSIDLFIFSGNEEPVFFVLSEFSNRHSV